jgi:hypothetical protein
MLFAYGLTGAYTLASKGRGTRPPNQKRRSIIARGIKREQQHEAGGLKTLKIDIVPSVPFHLSHHGQRQKPGRPKAFSPDFLMIGLDH